MNNTISKSDIDDLQLSLHRLKDSMPANILFIIFGSIAVILNLWTIICVWRSKSLHTKCFALLATNAFVDLLMGASYAGIASTRLYRSHTGMGEVITMWQCCWEASLITLSQMLSLGMSCALVIDRLAATLAAHQYKNWTYKKFTVPMILVTVLFALTQYGVHIMDSWKKKNTKILTCGIEDTITEYNLMILLAIQIGTSGGVVILNCLLAILIRKQHKKFHANPIQIQNQTRTNQIEKAKNEMRMFKTITLLVIMHIFTHLGGRIILAVVSALTSDVHTQSMTSRYTRQLVVINAAIHFFLLLATSTQFRVAVVKMSRNSNSVAAATHS